MKYAIIFVLAWAATFLLILAFGQLRKWRQKKVEAHLWDMAGRRVEKATTAAEDQTWKGNRDLWMK